MSKKPDIDDCPKCKRRGVLRQQVSIFADAPLRCTNLSKSGIRSRDVHILGVGWPQAVWYCPACGWRVRVDAEET